MELAPFSYVAAAGNVVTYLGGIQVIVAVLVFVVTKVVQSSDCCRRFFEPSMLHEDDEVRGGPGWEVGPPGREQRAEGTLACMALPTFCSLTLSVVCSHPAARRPAVLPPRSLSLTSRPFSPSQVFRG